MHREPLVAEGRNVLVLKTILDNETIDRTTKTQTFYDANRDLRGRQFQLRVGAITVLDGSGSEHKRERGNAKGSSEDETVGETLAVHGSAPIFVRLGIRGGNVPCAATPTGGSNGTGYG